MGRGLLISASDTDAGKTVVACGLIAALRAAGCDAVGYKPVESGCDDPDRPADGLALWHASGQVEPLDAVCPVRLSAALAPNLAARAQGETLSHDAILEGYQALAARHQAVIVETAGGTCSPLTDGWLAANLAAELDLPVLLVVPDRLGAIHQAVAARAGAAEHGARVTAVLLNGVDPEPDGTSAGNRGELQRLLPDLRVIVLPFLGEGLDSEHRAKALARALPDPLVLLG